MPEKGTVKICFKDTVGTIRSESLQKTPLDALDCYPAILHVSEGSLGILLVEVDEVVDFLVLEPSRNGTWKVSIPK